MTPAAPAPDLGAVIVALRGGAALSRALDDVAWTATRTLLDPAGLATDVALPAGVSRCITPTAALDHVGASTVLLLTDVEIGAPALRSAVAALPAMNAASVSCGWRSGDLRLASRVRRIRIAPRATASIGLDRRFGLVLRSPAPVVGLDAVLDATVAGDVAEATAALDGETRALAALLRTGDRGPTAIAVGRAALAAGWEAWRARAGAAPRPARWILAMLVTYRVVLAHARAWELAYAAGAA